MSKLKWDEDGKRLYETGVDHGVLYLSEDKENNYNKAYAWNGLTGVTDSPSGAEPSATYADNIKYLSLMSAEEYGCTIEAYTYPPEFGVCDGSAEIEPGITIGQQDRKSFGFSYRTILGNDTEKNEHGYKIHLVYGALAAPSERSYQTVNDSPEAITMSWEVSTTPVQVEGHKPTSSLVIDSTTLEKDKLEKIEKVLYGDESTEARLPLPDEILNIVKGE